MTHRKRSPLSTSKVHEALVALVCSAFFLQATGVAAQPVQRTASQFRSEGGTIVVTPVQQMSVVIETPDGVVYTDPTGGGDRYAAYRPPDVILISHEHGEHYDPRTLQELVRPGTRIVVPPYVMERLPESLKGSAVALSNGQSSKLEEISVEAIPSYGLSGQAARWHPRGRGNAYVVTVDGEKLYISGSTEAVPEMLALRDIDIAFLPLYPPYALGPEDAVKAAAIMQPRSVYIYQYNSDRTRDDFLKRIGGAATQLRVVAPDIP